MTTVLIALGWITAAVCAIGWRIAYRDMKSWRYQFFRQKTTYDDLAGVETPDDRLPRRKPRIYVD